MVNLHMGWQKSPALYRREREKYLAAIQTRHGKAGLEKYLSLEKQQNGHCAICDRKMILIADHKPRTRHFRGLICMWCNSILGNIERMPWILDRIKAYLALTEAPKSP